MAASAFAYSVDEGSFQQLVIDRSAEVPVVVDFWAPWCGPCRTLGPILEKLASEGNGSFYLAKINTDENQELAMAFQVEGIPAVFAVKGGQVVDQFVGMLPEAQIREWLKRIGAGPKAPEAPKAPEPPADETTLRKAIETNSEDSAARVKLAELLLKKPGTTDEIHSLLAPIEPGEHHAAAEKIKALLSFRDTPCADSDLTQAEVLADAQRDNPAVLAQLGMILAARGDYQSALDVLLQAAGEDKKTAREVVRPIMVNIFHILGVRSEISDTYRAKLQSLLY
jgi:putative thioredoxin